MYALFSRFKCTAKDDLCCKRARIYTQLWKKVQKIHPSFFLLGSSSLFILLFLRPPFISKTGFRRKGGKIAHWCLKRASFGLLSNPSSSRPNTTDVIETWRNVAHYLDLKFLWPMFLNYIKIAEWRILSPETYKAFSRGKWRRRRKKGNERKPVVRKFDEKPPFFVWWRSAYVTFLKMTLNWELLGELAELKQLKAYFWEIKFFFTKFVPLVCPWLSFPQHDANWLDSSGRGWLQII